MPDLGPLVGFLRARYDERERAARYVLSDYAQHEASWDSPSTGVVQLGDDLVPTGDGPLAHFIVDNDPEFVLADVESKRQIINLVDSKCGADGGYVDGWEDAAMWAVKALALPYAGHPEYREEWRP